MAADTSLAPNACSRMSVKPDRFYQRQRPKHSRQITYLSFYYETPPHPATATTNCHYNELFAQRPLRPYRQGV